MTQFTGLDAVQPHVLEEAPMVILNRVVLAVIMVGNVGTENEQDVLCVTPA